MASFNPHDYVGPNYHDSMGHVPQDSGVINQMMARDGGFAPHVRDNSVTRRRRVMEAAKLWNDCINGREEPLLVREAMNPTKDYIVRHLMEKYPGIFGNSYHDGARFQGGRIGLRETMSYSDFSALTVDILDRQYYGYYNAAPITNMPLVKQVSLRDFRLRAIYETDGGVSPWTVIPKSPATTGAAPGNPTSAGAPPGETAVVQSALEVTGSTQRVTYQPQAYQSKMAINWRALVNDDLGIFADLTQRLALGGRRLIYSYITSLYMSSTGPNTTLYSSTFNNIINIANGASKNNPSLDYSGISDALTVLALMRDLDGQPITSDGTLYLWFGPALLTTAMHLIKSLQADVSILGGTQTAQTYPAARLRVENWMTQGMVPIEDKYIPIVCTASGTKNTTWGLTYAPAQQPRPSIELGFLKGFESPQLFQRVPQTMRVGGGVDPMMGEWNSMDQEYKGLTVFGGTQVDGRSTVASTGQNV